MPKKQVYIPDLGDVVWLDFDPQKGHKIMKRRPALILTSKRYNQTTKLCFACPITSQIKGYASEVPVHVGKKPGVVLTHQLKSLDWQSRQAELISKAPKRVLLAAQDNIAGILFGA